MTYFFQNVFLYDLGPAETNRQTFTDICKADVQCSTFVLEVFFVVRM